MVRELREEMTTSHIPIVMLTAKSTIESKIEGMKLGADDYITKPFSAAYLKARIFNLLEQRKNYRHCIAPVCCLHPPNNLWQGKGNHHSGPLAQRPEIYG